MGLSDQSDELQVSLWPRTGLLNGVIESAEDNEDRVAPLPTEASGRVSRSPRMATSCYGNLWGSGALVQEDGKRTSGDLQLLVIIFPSGNEMTIQVGNAFLFFVFNQLSRNNSSHSIMNETSSRTNA